MTLARRLAILAALCGTATVAAAQPVDPYADPPKPPPAGPPKPPPAGPPKPAPPGDAPRDPYEEAPPAPPASGDPELDDAVATALIARARALSADGAHADAKQLVVEALVRSPQGPTADEARVLLAELNRKLGISDAPPPPTTPPPDLGPSDFTPPVEDLEEPVTSSTPQQPSGFVRYAGGVVAGATAGGLFADVVDLEGTTGGDVVVGAVLGGLGGGLAAYALGSPELTRGDHALIDSMAMWGLVGGLTLGLALDPPEGEAYSLNGVFGIGGGYLIGHVAARRSDVTPARMMRVNGYALAGAAVPWILYGLSSDDTTRSDEQAFGFLSTAGLVAGAYMGFRWTRNMASGSSPTDDAPAALFQRGRAGTWGTGGLALQKAHAQGRGAGATLTVVSGAF